MAKAIVVIGLGFGDEGKGSVTDYLTRKHSAHTVVRFNSGHQAAHNVVTSSGQHHTFSQFGSGHLAGAKTYLSARMVIEPFAMLREAMHLQMLTGEDPFAKLTVSYAARVTNPYQARANQVREAKRGVERHGSCGVGYGETCTDEVKGYVIHAANLRDSEFTTRHLRGSLELKKKELGDDFGSDLPTPEELATQYKDFAEKLTITNPNDENFDDLAASEGTVIFEGAQGVLLDRESVFFPHVTYAETTLVRASNIITRRAFTNVECVGVTRSYLTRHGFGPFPTEGTFGEEDDHNKAGKWQGDFRTGALDLELLRYAKRRVSGGGLLDLTSLAVTHMDRFPRFVATHYKEGPIPIATDRWNGRKVTPVMASLSSQADLYALLESTMGVPVDIVSHGPTAAEKGHWREQ